MQVFLTTDHPNGGPFTAYPHLIHLLTSYDFRMSIFERLHADVRASSPLPSLKREYTLDEIIKMTRLGPARSLGLVGRGSLQAGDLGDVVVYEKSSNMEKMFARPRMVFRRGKLVFRDGEFLADSMKSTVVADVQANTSFDKHLSKLWREQYGYSTEMIRVRSDELVAANRSIDRIACSPDKS
jgi:formylmethanofuran dehydrogenase subunit A